MRNPAATTQKFTFKLADVLELPAGYHAAHVLFNVISEHKTGQYDTHEEIQITLAPFEVMVWRYVAVHH